VSRPRALVVRSGANPFLTLAPSPGVEIVERVSHSIRAVTVDPEKIGAAVDLAVFTSQVAVERVFGEAPLASAFRRALAGGRVAAVGRATEKALRGWQVEPDLVARGSAESVLEKLPRSLDGVRVLFPCGQDASSEIPEGLRSRGATVQSMVVYRKDPQPPDPELPREIVERPFAAFCTTSPSAARWLFEGLPGDAAVLLRRTPAVVLGPFTRRYLESHGVERVEVSGEASFGAAARLLETLAAEAERGRE
jgi:uroporphyrinogen-III synthase